MIVDRVNAGQARALAQGIKLGRGNRKLDKGEKRSPSADEKRWGMSRAELEKRILSLHKGGTSELRNVMSALGQMQTHALPQTASLFDHLIGEL